MHLPSHFHFENLLIFWRNNIIHPARNAHRAHTSTFAPWQWRRYSHMKDLFHRVRISNQRSVNLACVVVSCLPHEEMIERILGTRFEDGFWCSIRSHSAACTANIKWGKFLSIHDSERRIVCNVGVSDRGTVTDTVYQRKSRELKASDSFHANTFVASFQGSEIDTVTLTETKSDSGSTTSDETTYSGFIFLSRESWEVVEDTIELWTDRSNAMRH